jgi:hypothetical protein
LSERVSLKIWRTFFGAFLNARMCRPLATTFSIS